MHKQLFTLFTLMPCLVQPAGLVAQAPPTEMRYSGWQRGQPAQLGVFGPTVWIKMDTVGTWVLVPGTPAEVFRKTRHIYETMKLQTPLVDSVGGILGNPGFKHTGALAGGRMSSWIRCGEGMTGPNADTWRITMALLSSVERVAEDTTRLRTAIVATANNLAEGGRTPITCTSSGHLEGQIHSKVRAMPPAPSGNE